MNNEIVCTTPPASITPHQVRLLAHLLTLEGSPEQEMSRALAGARVDMNPHQVEAALFALRSPLSKGVILAAEVGLGKTIEAGLVIAQRWAELRRRIVLVVPATLRKQWAQELLRRSTASAHRGRSNRPPRSLCSRTSTSAACTAISGG